MRQTEDSIRTPAGAERVAEAARTVWDAIVLGAGPAGSAAAWGLARRGARVLLVDRDTHPRAKVCGCCLGPVGVGALRAIGVLERLPAITLDRVAFVTERGSTDLPLPRTVTIARDAMDHALMAAAADAGATVLAGVRADIVDAGGAGAPHAQTGHAVVGLRASGSGTNVRTRAVVDARGLLAKSAERAESPGARYVGLGVVLGGAEGVSVPDALRMGVDRAGYLGAAPLPGGKVTLAAAVRADALGERDGRERVLGRLLERIGVARGERGQEIARSMRGVPTLRVRRPAQRARVLRVGDAARFVEPVTGEGMGWALRAGLSVPGHALAPERGTWARAHRSLLRRSFVRCAGVSALAHRPGVLGTALGVVGALPAVRGLVVGMASGRGGRGGRGRIGVAP